MPKNEIKNNFNYYLKKSKISILIIFVTLLFSFGMRLISTGFSIDTEMYILDINRAGRWTWLLSLNRYGLVLLNTIFQLNQLPIFVQNFITFIFIICYSVMYCYLFYKYIPEKYKDSFLKYQFIFPILFITNPIFVEQYNFVLQSVSVSLSILLIPISILLIDYASKLDSYKKYILFLLSILIVTLIFGVYQSIILLYILTICSVYLLKIISDKDNNLKWLIKHIIVFGISAFCYMIIGKTFTKNGTGYLTIAWTDSSIKEGLINIKNCIISVVKCETIFYNISYVIALLLICLYVIYILFKNKKNIIAKLIAIVGIISGPFYIMIITGVDQLKRTQFNYSFVGAFIIVLFITYLSYKQKKKILIISIIITSIIAYRSGYYSSSLFHTANEIYLEDRYFADTLNNNIISQDWYDENKDYKLIFVGKKESNINAKNIYLKSEIIGSSFFNFDYKYIYGVNERGNAFMHTLGYNYIIPTNEEFIKAKEYVRDNNINIYPKSNSIILYNNNTIIVRLSEEK